MGDEDEYYTDDDFDEIQFDEFVNADCESLDDCISLKRIICVLDFYKDHYDNEDAVNLYLKTQYKYLLNDFHHILDKHLNLKTMQMTECNEEFQIIYAMMLEIECVNCMQCPIFLRNQSEREKDTILSHGFIVDALDGIHSFFLHSVDSGYRVMDTSIDQNNICAIKQYLKQFEKLNRCRRKNNKFETQIDEKLDCCVIQSGFGQKQEFHDEFNKNSKNAKYEKLKN